MSAEVPAPNLAERLDFFRSIPVFGGLPDEDLSLLCDLAAWRRYDVGETIVREGDLAREMFVVMAGRVEVFKGVDGRYLTDLGVGDCIGEMALIDIQPRSATVAAAAETTLMVIGFDDVARLYQTSLPSYTLVVLNIAREISRRLRETNQQLADLGGDESICP